MPITDRKARISMTLEKRCELERNANRIRQGILTSTYSAQSGHPGGSLSSADLFACLYSGGLNVDPRNPQKADRDRFVLSKGHVTPAYYSALAMAGFFPEEELKSFRACGSRLQGHPNMNMIPGVDMSTGSLGQGLSAAAGMALGAKRTGQDFAVYALVGDGEMAEGQIWEALLFSAHHELDNLCVFADVNGLQIDGKTEDVMNTKPLDAKFKSFGFRVMVIDGHDFDELEQAFSFFKENRGSGQPTAVLMNTVKGKGVSFMENDAGWHGKAPNAQQYEQGMRELRGECA